MQHKLLLEAPILKHLRSTIESIPERYPLDEAIMTIIYLMYGVHKKYVFEYGKFSSNDDIIAAFEQDNHHPHYRPNLYNIYRTICTIPEDEFSTHYSFAIYRLLEFLSYNTSKDIESSLTPSAINCLIADYIKNSECKSVYEPFCGSASLVRKLPESSNIRYIGSDISYRNTIVAKILLDASGIDGSISVEDCISRWDRNQFDAVVTCPPFGYKLTKQERYIAHTYDSWDYRTLEDLIIRRTFIRNKAKMLIMQVPTSFCFNASNKPIREWLVENGLLDTIIYLPANINFGTSIATCLLVCTRLRNENDPIKFVHVEDCSMEEFGKFRKFDYRQYVKRVSDGTLHSVSLTRDQIQFLDYSFAPVYNCALHYSTLENHPLEERFLDDFLTSASISRYCTGDGFKFIGSKCFNSEFTNIVYQKNMFVESTLPSQIVFYDNSEGKTLILANTFPHCLGEYYICSEPSIIAFPRSAKVFVVDDTKILPEYLLFRIVECEMIAQSGGLQNCLHMKVPVATSSEDQQKLVEFFVNRDKEMQIIEKAADESRHKAKKTVSDLEHMLGTPQSKIENILSILEEMHEEDTDYHEALSALKDNYFYMQRLIKYNNASINSTNFNFVECEFVGFLHDYVKGWDNYGGNIFAVNIQSEIDNSPLIKCDIDAITMMLDAIFKNASKHGFHTNSTYTDNNRVELMVSLVEYSDHPYLLLQIANNGERLSDNFTLADYVSKGKYASQTGGTGLGGYHVFKVIKGHNGYISLSKSLEWSLIIELLIPVENVSTDKLYHFDHECI